MQKNRAFVLFLLVVAMALPSPAQSAPAQPVSDREKNKAIARTFFEEVLSPGKLEMYSDFHTADFVAHGTERDFTLAEDLATAREERKAMPDLQFAVNHMVAEGDLVVVHWTAWGTNTQPGMGLPATGKPIRISGMTLFRFKAGKISEEWNAWNVLSVLKQAGLFPPKP
ncbi:MAG: ester cyclase [Terriglobales bacterium]